MLSPETANVSVDFSSKMKLSHSSVFVIKGYIFNKKSRNKKRKLNIRLMIISLLIPGVTL